MKITVTYKNITNTAFQADKLVIEDNYGNVFTIAEGKMGLRVTKIENKLLSREIKNESNKNG